MEGEGGFLALYSSSGDPYLKILEFSKLFVADAHMLTRIRNSTISMILILDGNSVMLRTHERKNVF